MKAMNEAEQPPIGKPERMRQGKGMVKVVQK